MNRVEIPFDKLSLNVFNIWQDALLLTAGENEPGKFNAMTIGWGSIGYMWKVPIVQVMVRPGRYTYEFTEKYDSFTVSVFGPEYKQALTIMGTKSGRDGDKIKEAKLTPCPSHTVAAPGFEEAQLILECRKIYYDDLKAEHCTDAIAAFYPKHDWHRLYIGQVEAVYGANAYLTK